jgi:YVTN family beta-propeller protein
MEVAVNPATNKVYVANQLSRRVTVIDGATLNTTPVAVDTGPSAVAVNPVTNKIYVASWYSNSVTVIDGATNNTTPVPVGSAPAAVAVNQATNKIYVANSGSNNVTVIDGATNGTATVAAGSYPQLVAVNPVTNKVYVGNQGSRNVTVIDGATNATTTVPAGSTPYAIAVNPATDKIYVALGTSNNVTVITDAPVTDSKVRAAFDRLPGDTTALARPPLSGKGVNRLTPSRTAMIGVGNRVSTGQMAWDWATVTSGAGTDSITWSYNWGADSLVWGENFVCCVPLEDQAASTNNLGLGSPFAGNLEVYPVYRINSAGGVEEKGRSEVRPTRLPTVARGVLFLDGDSPRTGTAPRTLLDTGGRQVMALHSGANDVRALAPGVYFVREEPQAASYELQAVYKVVVAR